MMEDMAGTDTLANRSPLPYICQDDSEQLTFDMLSWLQPAKIEHNIHKQCVENCGLTLYGIHKLMVV